MLTALISLCHALKGISANIAIDGVKMGFYIRDTDEKLKYVLEPSEELQLCKTVAKKIDDNISRNGPLNLMISIGNGGNDICRYISHFLESDKIEPATIRTSSYKSRGNTIEQERTEVRIMFDNVCPSERHKRIIIVDDMNDTGEAMKTVYEHVKGRYIDVCLDGVDIITAVLQIKEKENQEFMADIYGEKIPDVWYILPREYPAPLEELLKMKVSV